MSDQFTTCLQHNDKEGEFHSCPICLESEITTLRSQVERLTGEREQLSGLVSRQGIDIMQHLDDLHNLTQERDQAVASCAVMREALVEWKLYYESQLADCDSQIAEFTKSKDTHGVNFHQGRKSGIIQHDIGLQRFKDAMESTTFGNSLLERLKEARELLSETDIPDDVPNSWYERRDTWLKGTP